MIKIRSLMAVLLLGLFHGVQAQDLIGVYKLALENDPQLREIEEQLNSARQSKNLSRAQLLPTIGLGASYDLVRQDIKSTSFSGREGTENFNNTNLGLTLSMPIYRRDFLIQLEQSDSIIAQAEAQYAAAQINLMVRSTIAYFNILAKEDDLRVVQAELDATGRQLEQAQQRFEVGLIAITDVHEAQAAHDSSRALVIEAENNVDSAWEALFEIIGPQARQEMLKLGDGLELNPPSPNDLQVWSDTAQQQNFDIIANRSGLETIRQQIEVSRSGHYPTLDLVGGYNMSRTDSDNGSDVDTGTIGLELALPLYTGGAVTSQTDQDRADYRAAQHSLDRTRRAVNRQVRDAFRGVLSTISRVEALRAATVSAKSALDSTEAGYEVGTRTIVDVLNVQRNLYSSQRDYLNSRYDYIVNGLQLKSAAGNLSAEDLQRANTWLEP